MALEIVPVRTGKDLRRFLRLPWRIYAGDPVWVPPLLADLKQQFDRSKNPFFEHGEVESFLAVSGGEVVGRISAIENRAHTEFHGEPAGFFGFFEVWDGTGSPAPDGQATTRALIDAAEAWVRGRGLEILRGPMNFSTNDSCGVLVDGFEDPPTIMMTYNPAHYDALLRGAGLAKAKDLLAYFLTRDKPIPDRVLRGVALIEKRHGITIRPLRKSRFREELGLIKDIYNEAWDANWGFVPMTSAEIDHLAKEFKPFLNENLVLFAEKGDETIGFAWALADWNQAIRYANGRLLPFGLLRILWNKRRIDRIRVLTLGIRKKYRGLGADNLLYLKLHQNGGAEGFQRGEFSWILEDNEGMRRPMDRMGAWVHKTYRVYEKTL